MKIKGIPYSLFGCFHNFDFFFSCDMTNVNRPVVERCQEQDGGHRPTFSVNTYRHFLGPVLEMLKVTGGILINKQTCG